MSERIKRAVKRTVEEVKATKADLRGDLPDGVVMPEVQPLKPDPEAEAVFKARLAEISVGRVIVSPARHGQRPPHVPRERSIPPERRTPGR